MRERRPVLMASFLALGVVCALAFFASRLFNGGNVAPRAKPVLIYVRTYHEKYCGIAEGFSDNGERVASRTLCPSAPGPELSPPKR
jgi:hypothetical protein